MIIPSGESLPPTYQLNPGSSPNANRFYRDVSDLVDDMLDAGSPLEDLTQRYRQSLAGQNGTQHVTHEESLLELLTLGVLWIARGREAIMQSPAQRNLVTELVRERRNGCSKRQDGSRNDLLDFGAPLDFSALQPSLADLQRLRSWLLATGEYDDEVARMEGWLSFFEHSSNKRQRNPLKLLVTFGSDFAKRAEARLGQYTQRVDEFLRGQLPLRRQREDAVQCSRRRIEYHLNLFAAELLNRVWRDEFLACKQRVVVLSGCLRLREDEECRAIRGETSMRCSHCAKGCVVSAVTRLAARYGSATATVIHGSDFTRFLKAARESGAGTGIVGVACAPGIMGAGLRAKALGMPAQCAVLYTSACDHWRTKRVPSSFDLGELGRLLSGHNRTLIDSSERLRA